MPTVSGNLAASVTLADGTVFQDASPLFAGNLDQPTTIATLTADVAATAGFLPLLEQPGYIPRRIVGYADAYIASPTPTILALLAGGWPQSVGSQVDIHFGIFIDRVNEAGQLENLSAWNPFIDSSNQKRWLFERLWSLEEDWVYEAWKAVIASNGPDVANANQAFPPGFPRRTIDYNYLGRSSRIDIKPRAKVGFEERLFTQFAYRWVNPENGAANVIIGNASRFRMFGTPIRNARR